MSNTAVQTNEIIKVVDSSGLEAATGLNLKEKFLPFFDQAEQWKKKAEALVVNDVTQVREMKLAREARLALKEIRVNADKTRKELKEDSLRYGKAVQGVYNVIEYLIVPLEKDLEQKEKFAEIQEAKRKEALREERVELLRPLAEFVPHGLDLGAMTESDFIKVLNGAKLQQQAKIEADRIAEEERIAKEKEEAEAREQQRLENIRLKKEAEEKEKLLAIEREKAAKLKADQDAKLKAEREKREKIEKELEEKRQADLKKKKEEEAAAKAKALADKKAANLPDKKKLLAFALQIKDMDLPEVKGDDAKDIVTNVEILLAKVVDYINGKAKDL